MMVVTMDATMTTDRSEIHQSSNDQHQQHELNGNCTHSVGDSATSTSLSTPGRDHVEEEDTTESDGDDDEESDDDVTVIVLDQNANDDDVGGGVFVDHDSPEMRERRRNVLLRELQRVQRAR